MLEIENEQILEFKNSIDTNNNVIEKINKFILLIDNYQKKFNLIGKSTRENIWSRHILDSAQIINYLPEQKQNDLVLDVGTGAGFPGIVLSILGRTDIVLCDKSYKKTNFLKLVSEECELKVKIFKGQIEEFQESNIKIILSRAFSPLKKLFRSVKHIIEPETIFLIHKGKSYMSELEEASNVYTFNYKCYKSLTDPCARIIKINQVVKI